MRLGVIAVPLMGAVSLVGCISPEPAVIFDLERDKAIIQARAGIFIEGDAGATTDADIMDKAWEACGLYGRQPKPISEWMVGDHRRILFACVENDG